MRGDSLQIVSWKGGRSQGGYLDRYHRPGCYALQYIALRHPSAFKVGIKYPGQEWYDLGLTVTDKDDIQYLFGQILFYLRSIRAK